MKRSLAVLAFGMVMAASRSAVAQAMEMHVSIGGTSSLFASGNAIYTDRWGNYPAIDMSLELWIRDIRDSLSNTLVSTGLEHVHASDYSLNVSGNGAPGKCYTARFAASGGGAGNEVGSSQVCVDSPPPPAPPPSPPADQNGGNTDWSGTGSPILINLAEGPYRLSGLDDPVSFDITGDGRRDLMGWTGRGTSLAFLALDRNANGAIDDGRELFGDATPLANGTRASNGFQAVKEYDSNHDGRIDNRDAIWSSLLLWTDSNHDGATQSAEFHPIAQSVIRSIDLDFHRTGRRDRYGTSFVTSRPLRSSMDEVQRRALATTCSSSSGVDPRSKVHGPSE